jgi:predicted nucleic acid-binding protein
VSAVFLDTVGLLATWDQSDQWHVDADAAFQQLLSTRRTLVTTPHILHECANAAARKPYRSRVSALRIALAQAGLIIDPTLAEIDDAWAEYDRGAPGQPGIVDLISFAIMRRNGLTDAFTNDRHFAAAGFNRLF